MTDKTRELLYSIRYDTMRITELDSKQQELEYSLGPRAIAYDKCRVQTSPSDPMLRVMSELADVRSELDQAITLRAEHAKRIEQACAALTREEACVIRSYYIGRKSMREIAEAMSYEKSTIYKLRNTAEGKLDQIVG